MTRKKEQVRERERGGGRGRVMGLKVRISNFHYKENLQIQIEKKELKNYFFYWFFSIFILYHLSFKTNYHTRGYL